MKSIQAIIVMILCLVGCRGDSGGTSSGGGSGGPPPNPCEEMGCDYTPAYSQGSYFYPSKCECPDTTGGTTMGVADSSGGDTSEPGCELHEYRCNMKQIGVYGSSAESPIRSINPQAGNYGEGETFACLTVDIVFPESALNSGMLEQACIDACYAEDVGLISQGGAAPSLFYLSNLPSGLHNPACVFADVEDLSDLDGYPGSGSAVCAGQATTRIVDQGPATDTQCAVAIESCDEWDPQAYVAHVGRGTAHEIHVDEAFATALYSGGEWGYLYACDAARYQQILSSGVESWKVVEATSGTLLYSLGLRSGDKDFTIAHTPAATQYALNSFAALAAAAEQMAGDNQLTLRWQRQNTAGAWVTHTAELWFD